MKRFVRLVGPQQRAYATRLINEAADGDFVTISKPTRTLEQNARLWPMLEDIQRQVSECAPYTTEELKLRFLNALGVEMRFLPVLEGEGMFPVGLRSSTLTKDQFSALLELLFMFGAKHNVRWSEPIEQERAA